VRNPITQHRATQLRNSSTDAERRLWRFIRQRQLNGYRFRRQVPIGCYIADFVCFEARLIVELDGGQHSQSRAYDARRERFLTGEGYQVLRFWNNDVLQNMDGVFQVLMKAVGTGLRGCPSAPSLTLPRGAGEGKR